ncbi:uroporphyrinogen decarboxylase family protein [Metaclostridioides mangenotii]|uniref:uroporphyrinogen decarboxylase family protein n=1 Tax=Metaclostridioides mangenotii TaxID=1540 RepID=UPI00068E8603|nr:uroporphyrinogen decarboxylase family protein [Clostridioides mangenotii]
MSVKNIFKCIGSDNTTVSDEILDKLGVSFEVANKDSKKMAELSRELKRDMGIMYCIVPFCHTAEAGAFGSTVVFDSKAGNRINQSFVKDVKSLESIEPIDFSTGRMHEILESIKELKDAGEKVCLNVTGPITIATAIVDNRLFYKLVRKDREVVDKLLGKIEDSLVEYITKGVNAGVDIISFADPAGTLDIVGPKVYEDLSGKSTLRVFKRVEGVLGDSVVHICGKTSTSLEESGLINSKKVSSHGNSYGEVIENYKSEDGDAKFIGHWCIKREKNDKSLVCCDLL